MALEALLVTPAGLVRRVLVAGDGGCGSGGGCTSLLYCGAIRFGPTVRPFTVGRGLSHGADRPGSDR